MTPKDLLLYHILLVFHRKHFPVTKVSPILFFEPFLPITLGSSVPHPPFVCPSVLLPYFYCFICLFRRFIVFLQQKSKELSYDSNC